MIPLPSGAISLDFLRQLDVWEHSIEFEMDFYRTCGATFEEWSQDHEISSAVHVAKLAFNFASHMIYEPWSVFGAVPIAKVPPPRSLFPGGEPSARNIKNIKKRHFYQAPSFLQLLARRKCTAEC